LTALDFGAGSLRDTYHLSKTQIKVDAFDINVQQSKFYFKQYDWDQVTYEPNMLMGSDFMDQNVKYDIILAFDVIEHVIEIQSITKQLRNKLNKNGLMFVSVPNRFSLFEYIWKFRHRWNLKRGRIDKSGKPHVNFMSESEWKQFFQSSGFIVKDHDMAIGFFVNDLWHGIFGVVNRIFINPIISNCFAAFGLSYKAHSFEKVFYPRWLMKYVNEFDEATKNLFNKRWGWNLFVLSLPKV